MRGRYLPVLLLFLIGSWAGCRNSTSVRTTGHHTAPAPAVGLATSPWPKFRGNAGNTAIGVRSCAVGRIKWTFRAGARVQGSAAIGPDGAVYVWSDDGDLYALNGKTGAKKWSACTRSYPWWRKILMPHALPGVSGSSSPAVGANGVVYIGSHDSHVYALDAGTGTTVWRFKTGAPIEFPPAIGPNGTVYIASSDGRLYALDGKSGREIWEFREGSSFLLRSSPAIGRNGTVYIGSIRGKLYALDAASGIKKWEFTAKGDLGTPVIGPDGTAYCASPFGRLYAIGGATGVKKWECAVGKGMLSSPAIGPDGTIYLGSMESSRGRLHALDGVTLKHKWEFETGPIMPHPAVGSDGTVYVSGCGAGGGKLYAVDGKTGRKKWAMNIGGGLTRFPAIGVGGIIYVGTTEGKVCAIH